MFRQLLTCFDVDVVVVVVGRRRPSRHECRVMLCFCLVTQINVDQPSQLVNFYAYTQICAYIYTHIHTCMCMYA